MREGATEAGRGDGSPRGDSISSTSRPRLVLEVCWGPHLKDGGRKVVIEPGQTLRIGRAERVDLPIPGDDQLSASHFEISWDGAKCRLRDLKSARGTFVAGNRITEVEVDHGAWLTAGQTHFMVWVEGRIRERATITDEIDDDDSDENGEDAEFVRERAQFNRENERIFRERLAKSLTDLSRRERLHAVLDAARDERILELVRTSADEHRSLYDGAQGEGLAEVAPYLVRLSPGSPLIARLVEEGWRARWGVFLLSNQPFKDVRRHLRRFLMVEDEESGDAMYFRFYDPEVLRTFLPTCSLRQAEEFWGDVDTFLFEDEEGDLMRIDRSAAIAEEAS